MKDHKTQTTGTPRYMGQDKKKWAREDREDGTVWYVEVKS